jgi:glycosyltransferase involved in cell wall biosynthesis
MRVLVWQWGRHGAGPRLAVEFAAQFNALPGIDAPLSLAAGAEILQIANRPPCALPVATYATMVGYAARVMLAPLFIPRLTRRLRELQPTLALCAMPGPLDLAMHVALRRIGVPYAVLVHDADPHPGDGYPMQMILQRQLLQRADAIVVLSDHVRTRLTQLGLTQNKPVLKTSLPPLAPAAPLPPRAHGGKLRLLCFGRLLPYKGLDLLAEALAKVLPCADLDVRVVGSGPESAALAALRGLPGVSVENRWVPEHEVDELLAWSDAVVLTHREASQSGVAAAALAAGRWIVSTRVGGIAEQLDGQPMALLCAVDAAAIAARLEQLLTDPPAIAAGPAPDWRRDATLLAAQLGERLGPG